MIGRLLALVDAARHRARRRRSTPEQAAGRRGEDLAHRYLEARGMRVVARNWRPAGGAGEIDLIAWERDTLVFVEVKARASDEYGAPARNVDGEKRRALVRAGRSYARRAGVAWERVRLDLVSVILSDPPAIEHEKDAFAPGRTL
ncbi:MAG: YraN family protein [Acidobacteriota bacterium]